MQTKEINGVSYIDTPGLSDVELRKQAAEEISKALKSNGIFRIFFVCTLEAGRIRPDDQTTMSLVLESADVKTDQYSIIINKVNKGELNKIAAEKEKFYTLLNHGVPGTRSVFFHMNNVDIAGEDDSKFNMTEQFAYFIENAPCIEIFPTQVKDIPEDRFEQMKNMFESVINQLKEDNKKLREEQAEQIKKFEELNEINRREQERIRNEIMKQLEEEKKKIQKKLLRKQKEKEKISPNLPSNPPHVPPISPPVHDITPPSNQKKPGIFAQIGAIFGGFCGSIIPGAGNVIGAAAGELCGQMIDDLIK